MTKGAAGMKMHNPPHPGEIIRDQCLEPLGLTVTAAAKGLGVTRKALSELLNGHSGVSPEMAIRLSKAFGGTPETWLTPANAIRPMASRTARRQHQGEPFPGARARLR